MSSKVHNTHPTPPSNPFKHHCKKGYVHFKKGVSFCVDQAGDGGTVNTVAKFARRFFEFLAAFAPIAAVFGPAGVFFKNFTDVFKILAIFKNGKEFLNAENIRKAAASALGIGIASLSLVKLFDSFGWVNLANISASFGRVAIIGAIAIIPLSVFISWLESLKAGIEISLSISTLLKTAKKVAHVNEKKRFWETPIDKDKCKQRVHQYRKEGKELERVITDLTDKQEALQANVDKWSKCQRKLDKEIAKRLIKLDKKIAKENGRLLTQNKMKKCSVKTFALLRKIRPAKTTRELYKWEKLNNKVLGKLGEANTSYDKITNKKVTWQRMAKRYDKHIPKENKARYKADRKKIDEMQVQKLEHWKKKKTNLRLEQFKETASIALNVATIVLAVGGTALFIAGLVSTPAGGMVIPILMPALGLAVATVGLGMHFFKQYKGKKTQKVEFPELSTPKATRKRKKRKKMKKTSSTEESSDSVHALDKKRNKRKKERSYSSKAA